MGNGRRELRREEIRRERARRKRIRYRIKLFIRVLILICMVLLLLQCAKVLRGIWGEKGTGQETSADALQSAEKQETKKETNVADTLPENWDKFLLKDAKLEQDLKALAEEDELIAEIYAEREKYPEELLASLVSNTEMAEFVRGYLTADGTVQGGFSKEETEQKFPLFMQWDGRWGYVPYGGSNIGIAGCGPTCLSMVIFSLTGNEDATPDALAKFSEDNGHYVEGIGTSWTLMTTAASAYGLYAYEIGLDENTIKQNLDAGCPIICAMRAGDFTTSGHFIVLYDYDEEGFLVNDPNSRERSSKRWSFETIQYQIKNLWGFAKY